MNNKKKVGKVEIDMGLIWMVAFLALFAFQGLFTSKTDFYDVSYSCTNDSMQWYSQGQASFSAPSSVSVNYFDVSSFLEGIKDYPKDTEYTVLSMHKRETKRYFKPFWRD